MALSTPGFPADAGPGRVSVRGSRSQPCNRTEHKPRSGKWGPLGSEGAVTGSCHSDSGPEILGGTWRRETPQPGAGGRAGLRVLHPGVHPACGLPAPILPGGWTDSSRGPLGTEVPQDPGDRE